jgi:hypothetical protein
MVIVSSVAGVSSGTRRHQLSKFMQDQDQVLMNACISGGSVETLLARRGESRFEGIMKCPTRYATDISPTTKRATDIRARQVEKDYGLGTGKGMNITEYQSVGPSS